LIEEERSEEQPADISRPPLRRSSRPRTRGGATTSQPQRQTQGETRSRRSRPSAQDRAEAATAVYRMDTAVLVGDGVRLQDLTKAKAAKVKRLRWDVLLEEWQPMPRFREIDPRFWIVRQGIFYESYHRHRLFPHKTLDWDRVSEQAGGADIRPHFAHFRGLLGLLEMGHNAYVEDWVRVFYNTVCFGQDRQMIWFMFGGEPYYLREPGWQSF